MPLHTPVRANSRKAGTCPHGLPLGACPICNGMAGGNSTSKRDIPRNVGEMSYNQCAAIGAMLKAQKLAKESAKQAHQNHLQALMNFQKSLENTHKNLAELAKLITTKFPKIISIPANLILINFVDNIVKFVQIFPKIIINISQKFIDISDKLAAIYGEIKLSIKENLEKFFKNIKKKFGYIFLISETDESNNEEKKIEEDKRKFELKTFIHRLYKNYKNKTQKDNQ